MRERLRFRRSSDGPKTTPRRRATTSARTRMLARALRPVLAGVLGRYIRQQPRPMYTGRALVIGPDPIRVLILGAGLAVGYGSAEKTMTLPQQLGQALQRELQRGVVVECRAQASVRLEQTIDLMGTAGAATFDVVIWSPTLEETFNGGTRRWTRNLNQTIDRVRLTGGPNVRVVLMGVPRSDGPHLLQRIGSTLADEVNARIESVANGQLRVEFLPVPPRLINSWDTPLFDAAYQERVVEDVAALLGRLQRQSAALSYARPIDVADHGAWSATR